MATTIQRIMEEAMKIVATVGEIAGIAQALKSERDALKAEVEALRLRCEQAEAERDDYRNQRHAYEAQLFGRLQDALGHPDDANVADMIAMLVEKWKAAEAEVAALTAKLGGLID